MPSITMQTSEHSFDYFATFWPGNWRLTSLLLSVLPIKKWEILCTHGITQRPKLIDYSKYYSKADIQIGDNYLPGIDQPFELLIPVYHRDELLSILTLSDEVEKMGVSPIVKHLNFIQSMASLVSVAIVNKRLHVEEIEREKFKRELELAAEMQKSLIPKGHYANKALKLNASYEPHNLIGGDYYDYFVDESRLVFCIADVSGKGISAAIFMSNFQAKLQALLKNTALRMDELVRTLHEEIDEIAKGNRFITFFIGEYNFDTHMLEYVNAGHNPPILLQKDELIYLNKGTTGLGMVRKLPAIKTGSQIIYRKDILVCYTDGVTEAANKKGEMFGTERLENEILTVRCETPKTMNERLTRAVGKFRGKENNHDDSALLTLCFN
jgi:sigma-B regulation protein RsbU (phosphoserine phosphatase)